VVAVFNLTEQGIKTVGAVSFSGMHLGVPSLESGDISLMLLPALGKARYRASQANEIVEIGVLNSWVMLLIKSFFISESRFWRKMVAMCSVAVRI